MTRRALRFKLFARVVTVETRQSWLTDCPPHLSSRFAQSDELVKNPADQDGDVVGCWVGSSTLSPASTRNTDEPRYGSFTIRMPEPSLEAATWKTGLKDGFGLTAMMAFDFFESK
jgi:hypothetical protein